MDLIAITDDAICEFLASQIRAERLRRGLSQAKMAEATGIALRTYKRIELKGTGTIKNLVIILRAVDRIPAVKLLFPHPHTNMRPSMMERFQQIADEVRNK